LVNRIIKTLEETLEPLQLPEDRRRLAITVEKYLKTAKLGLTNNEDVGKFKEILQKVEYKIIREATSLSAAGSVFIILFREGKLAGNPPNPSGLRGRYLITQEMVDFCPELRKVPADRRVELSTIE
jgi:hypothetical protein